MLFHIGWSGKSPQSSIWAEPEKRSEEEHSRGIASEIARTKVLGREFAWCVWRTAGRPGWLLATESGEGEAVRAEMWLRASVILGKDSEFYPKCGGNLLEGSKYECDEYLLINIFKGSHWLLCRE